MAGWIVAMSWSAFWAGRRERTRLIDWANGLFFLILCSAFIIGSVGCTCEGVAPAMFRLSEASRVEDSLFNDLLRASATVD
jgi:hypothetical protein